MWSDSLVHVAEEARRQAEREEIERREQEKRETEARLIRENEVWLIV